MKKSLLALVITAAFAGVVQAQSTLEVYGLIDVGYMLEKADTQSGNVVSTSSEFAQVSGIQSGSRFGLKGSEDLGNGYRANFLLEAGFNTDVGTSTQGGRLFGRGAWVGLSSDSAGEIRIGRQTTVSSNMFLPVDPFSAGYKNAAAGTVFNSIDTLRLDNTITYLSPSFSGFKFGVNYSTKIDESNSPEGRASDNNRLLGAAMSYKAENLYLVATYDRLYIGNTYNASGTVTTRYKNRNFWTVGGTYDFGFVQLHAAVGQMDGCRLNTQNRARASGLNTYLCASDTYLRLQDKKHDDYTSDTWMIGATVPLAYEHSVFAAYSQADAWDLKNYAVGYTYRLSPRTNLYTYYGITENKQSRSRIGAANNQSLDIENLAVGIRHRF